LNGCLNCQSPEDPRLGSTGVSSEIERRRVIVSIDQALTALRTLRDTQQFWLGLGPAFRVRFEDFQGDLAMLRAAYRE
jgi:hypothetical protein